MVNSGGRCTITLIRVDGPSVPRELYGVHEYRPACDSSTELKNILPLRR